MRVSFFNDLVIDGWFNLNSFVHTFRLDLDAVRLLESVVMADRLYQLEKIAINLVLLCMNLDMWVS